MNGKQNELKQASQALETAIKNPLVAVQVWNPTTKKIETRVTYAANHTGIARTLDSNQKIKLA